MFSYFHFIHFFFSNFITNISVNYSNVYVYQTLYKYVKVQSCVQIYIFEFKYYTHISYVYIFQILILQKQQQ